MAEDWRYLVRQIAADLAVPPADTLAALNRVRGLVVRAAHARVYAAASAERHAALAPELAALLARLDGPRAEAQSYGDRPLVIDRLVARKAATGAPLFVGLVNKGTQAGLVASSVPTATYADRDDEKLLDYLAGNLYAGHGAHGLFMKTWAAGLAYSNGMRPSVTTGRLVYYAERCPRIAQTLGFVIDELKRVKPDPSLVDYAVAQAFSSRTPAAYETRAAAYAADLADGVTPEQVKGFRARILELRGRKELAAALFARLEAVYGAVLPGYGPPSKSIADAVFWVAGPEAQIAGYEQWLKTVEAPDATVVRLYPRDFWVPRR